MELFLNFAKARYLKLTLWLVVLATLVYIFHQPGQPANGGTWYGYTLGTISALLIVWLMYFGRRKRDYYSTLGTVKGWLSAHVYLGTGLLVLATLHTGFQFGLNVHTLAYGLMCCAIFSGFYGAWAYIYLPRYKRENLKTLSVDEYFQNIEDTDRQIIKLSKNLPQTLVATIQSAIDRTQLGGNLFKQLTTRDYSCLISANKTLGNVDQATITFLLVQALTKAKDEKTALTLKQLIDLFGARNRFLQVLRRDIKDSALLKIWLFFHIPVSFALLAALIAHIVSVFIYW
ncbi:MAG: hypothetical protein ACSHW0_14110 [Thalassotalea sp.]